MLYDKNTEEESKYLKKLFKKIIKDHKSTYQDKHNLETYKSNLKSFK